MKKRCLALMLLIPLLAACPADMTEDGPQQTGTKVFFISAGEQERQLVTESILIEEPCSVAGLQALVESMYQPRQPGHESLIPSQVTLQNVTLSGAVATVDFSGEYQNLTALEQSLLSGGVALTLLGVEGVDYVRITSDGAFQPPMGDRYYSIDRILLNSTAIAFNAFDVMLYFITEDGGGLSAVQRTIKVAGEYPSPRTLLTELLTLPEEGGLQSPLAGAEAINSCVLDENGVCRVDLSELKSGPEGRLQVEALANTLAGDSGIEAVVVTVNGQPPSEFFRRACEITLADKKIFAQTLFTNDRTGDILNTIPQSGTLWALQ